MSRLALNLSQWAIAESAYNATRNQGAPHWSVLSDAERARYVRLVQFATEFTRQSAMAVATERADRRLACKVMQLVRELDEYGETIGGDQ